MNKRLMIVFICLAVLVLIVVCGAIVFTVKHIDVLVAGDNQNIDKAQIVTSSGIKNGISIFTLDEQVITKNIEKNVPYAKVVDVERAFPNKIRISVQYRQPLLAITLKNTNKMLIVDDEFKVLEVVDNLSNHRVLKPNGIELEVPNLDNICGNFINLDTDKINTLKNIIIGFNEVNLNGNKLLDFVANLHFQDDQKRLIIDTKKGVKLLIRRDTNAGENMQTIACYNKFNKLYDAERENNSYYIYVKNNGDCVYSDLVNFN